MIKPDAISARRAMRIVGVKLATAREVNALSSQPLLGNVEPGGLWFKLGLRNNDVAIVRYDGDATVHFGGQAGGSVIRVTMNPPSLVRTDHAGTTLPSLEQQLELLETAYVINLPR